MQLKRASTQGNTENNRKALHKLLMKLLRIQSIEALWHFNGNSAIPNNKQKGGINEILNI